MERAMIEARVQLEMEGVLPPEGMWTSTAGAGNRAEAPVGGRGESRAKSRGGGTKSEQYSL